MGGPLFQHQRALGYSVLGCKKRHTGFSSIISGRSDEGVDCIELGKALHPVHDSWLEVSIASGISFPQANGCRLHHGITTSIEFAVFLLLL